MQEKKLKFFKTLVPHHMKKKKSCLALSEQPLLMLISAAHLEMQLLGSGWDRGSTMLI